jgi:uncharacterized protein YndB with AHSA1/START domain
MAPIRREMTLDADLDEVWELIATAEGLERWLADEVELDPVAGGTVRTRTGERDDRTGTVEHVDAGRSLSFIWRGATDAPTRVTLAVSTTEVGTRLVVSETSLTGAVSASAAELRGMAWRLRLEVLAGCLVVA